MTGLAELAHHGINPTVEREFHLRDEALLHLTKELGESGFTLALTRKSLEELISETRNQLQHHAAHRDANGLIIIGLLDLTKLGLTTEEAAARKGALEAPARAALVDEHTATVRGHTPNGSYGSLAAKTKGTGVGGVGGAGN